MSAQKIKRRNYDRWIFERHERSCGIIVLGAGLWEKFYGFNIARERRMWIRFSSEF